MIIAMILLFAVGYFMIAVEHKTHINKAAVAIVLGITLWIMYMFSGETVIASVNAEAFKHFTDTNLHMAGESVAKQCAKFVSQYQVVECLGNLVQIILYLLAAMTIVEVIDVHNGFMCVTDRITTRDKRKLLWVICIMTFFMSAILDNLTTAIVMTILARKLVPDQRERWIMVSMIVIAANSGGAWTPTGDVTTIMLWINENITTMSVMEGLFLPSAASVIVPLVIVSAWLGKGNLAAPEYPQKDPKLVSSYISNRERNIILALGVGGLLFIPIFKALTGLPPFMGILLVLGVIWIYVGRMYDAKNGVPMDKQFRITRVFPRIDIATIFFFLGILLAVDALRVSGILGMLSTFLDESVHNAYVINVIIGTLSAVVDNVPLVAGAMGMYQMPTPDLISASSPETAAYLGNFLQDGVFWHLLAYCAGVGGSMLIIGSAAGVVVMGLEKITFFWYMKRITLIAAAGYFAGVGVFILQNMLVRGTF